MCLGCLVAGLGLAYDSEEAQEFIQQATATDMEYCPQTYGSFSTQYKLPGEDDCEEEDCDHETSAWSEPVAQITSYDQVPESVSYHDAQVQY